MGMSIGVTHSTAREGYHIYDEGHVMDLIRSCSGRTWSEIHHCNFDYKVLMGYYPLVSGNPHWICSKRFKSIFRTG